MRRAALVLAAFLFLLVLAGMLLWYLSYGVRTTSPSDAAVNGLTAPVRIEWHEDGLATIRTDTQADRHAALGYVHGQQHAWTLSLWKRAAEGRLAAWFGTGLLPADRLTRRLGLARHAREAYAQLPDEERARLQAYVNGLNAALAGDDVLGRDPFVLLDLTPEQWQPWHPLAIEHLFAWLATEPARLADSTATAPAPADSFRTADRLLRRWLHVYGLEHSSAWAARADDGLALFRRIVYGDVVLPLLQEVAVVMPDSTTVLGATLPGTPYFVTGQTAGRAWAVLPASTSRLAYLPAETFAEAPTHDRIEDEQGNEYLVTRHEIDGALALEAPPDDTLQAETPPDTLVADTLGAPRPPQPDSVLALQWDGLRAVTDWNAWHALLDGTDADFRLQRGDGLLLDQGGWRVTGAPHVNQRFASGVVVGNTEWSRFVAERLDTLATSLADSATHPREWPDDCHSTWAAHLTPTLLAAVDSVTFDTTSDVFDDALVYLRNWNYSYDRASIAASVFEAWVQQYHGLRDVRPTPLAPADTSLGEAYVRGDLLRTAVDSLAQRYGDDLSQWRWERVHRILLHFPVWSADSLVSSRTLGAADRYAPIERPGQGHPSAPCGGTVAIGEEPPAPAYWEAFSSTANLDRLRARQRAFRFDRFLDRYRIPSRPPAARELSTERPADGVTVLRPPDS